MRFALLWVGIYLGLIARGTGAVTAVQALEFPVAFLSGVFFAPAAMPAVVSTIAEWNPLTATAAASRELFATPAGAATPGSHSTPSSWPSPGHS